MFPIATLTSPMAHGGSATKKFFLMNEMIALLARNLGLPESTIASGIAVLVRLLKEKSTGGEFEKLAALVPGLAEISEKATAAPGGEGLFGGLLGAAGGMLGGQAADLAKAVAGFQQAGVPVDKIAPLVRGFLEQVQASGGADLVSQLASTIPSLKSVLGEIRPAS